MTPRSRLFSALALLLTFALGCLSEDWLELPDPDANPPPSGEDPNQVQGEDAASVYGGAPVGPYPLLVLERTGFTVGYDEARSSPAWVSYHLRGGPALDSGQRPSKFSTDEQTIAKVSHNDYTGSGFDRGHMAPNYAIATRYGQEAQEETFLMSNIIPQAPKLNQGLWRELEAKIAEQGGYAEVLGEVWVTIGPVYEGQPQTLPNTGIAIPDACFKIILDEEGGRPRALAFLVPQDLPEGSQPEQFLTSIDAIERATGLDFFTQLENGAESALESAVAPGLW